MKISKEAKVGILALVSGVVLYLGFNFLKGVDFFSPNSTYYAVYDNIGGLTESNPVMLNGLAIGRVKEIKILQEQNNKLLVALDITNDIALNDSTVALLGDSGPLGDKFIDLKIGKGSRAIDNQDTLLSGSQEGITEMLQKKIVPIASNLDSTIVNINRLVKNFQTMQVALEATLNNAKETSSTLNTAINENRRSIQGVMTNLNMLSSSLNDPQSGIKPLMGKMNTFADTLSQLELANAVNNANASVANLNEMLNKINQGQGSLGKLAKNDSLYNNLNNFAEDLDKLVVDLKENPKRYVSISVFGRKDKKEKKEKEEKETAKIEEARKSKFKEAQEP